MTTPKPTHREALSHLCWALTHGENADEDLRVLCAALEQLEWLRKQAEVFQDCNTGLARERDALRAENAALKVKLEVEAPLYCAAVSGLWYHHAAAAGEVSAIRHAGRTFAVSTPERDDRIRRETVERVLNDMGRSDLTPDELAGIYRAAGITEPGAGEKGEGDA